MATKYDSLKGVSAKLNAADMKKFKTMMAELKKRHGGGFSLSDLLQAVAAMPIDLLNQEVTKFLNSRNANISLIEKMNISEEAKAKIEAILAEEANGKA